MSSASRVTISIEAAGSAIAGVGAGVADRFHHLQARAVLKAHVQDREGRGLPLHRGDGVLDAAHQLDLEAALFQRPAQPDPERRVVVQQHEGLVGERRDISGEIGHSHTPEGSLG